MSKSKFILLLLLLKLNVSAQTQLNIPDTLVGPNFNLTIHEDSVQFFPNGNISHTYAFNQFHYLGPTLIWHKGDQISINVNNQINDTTTVHWHGIHLPAIWDGGPHTPIYSGANWNPQFTVMDQAATYWYHPHMHMKTAAQAIKGAAGLIIVRDSLESALVLPRAYGIDDFPIIVQSQQYDTLNQAMPLGMEDSTILVNGARANNGNSVFVNCPAQIVRMRLLNASGERVFQFGFSANKQFKIIASDGGLLNAPVNAKRIRLAPGERAEILIDLTNMNGQSLHLMSYGSELTMGIQGGPTMPMPNGPPMNSPLNGIDFNILQINVVGQTPNPILTIPTVLNNNTPFNATQANKQRTIRFTADSLMVMDGPFYFNDSSFDMMRVDYRIPINNIEIWKLVNETMVAHPFHIHDVQFYLLKRNGITPPLEESGRKDVVLVPPGDSVEFITKFADFADTTTPYMFHCHILMHEDAGMMGQFIVDPNPNSITESYADQNIIVFPNPFADYAYLKSETNLKNTSILIINSIGKTLANLENINDKQVIINRNNLPPGIYYLQLVEGKKIRSIVKIEIIN